MEKSILSLKLILACVFLVLAYTSAFPDGTITSINWEGQELEAISGEFVIQLAQGIDYSDLNNLLSEKNCWIADTCNILRLALIGFSQTEDSQILQKINTFKNSSLIRFAEPNFLVYPATGEEDEPDFDSLWGFHNIGQPIKGESGTPDVDVDMLEAWRIETGDSSCTISFIDAGVAMEGDTLCHSDLLDSNRIILDRDFREDGDVRDTTGHGTQVLGVAAAAKNDSGVIGVCYDCNFLVTKIDDDPESQYFWAKAIAHVCSLGADVINISRHASYSAVVETSLAYAWEKDVIIAAAAGNGSCDDIWGISSPAGYASFGYFIQGHNCCDPETCPNYPDSCGYRNVIAVGCIDRWNKHCDGTRCSNDTLRMTVAAPGSDIFVCTPPYINPDQYQYEWGTSLSAPLAAGICGLILSQKPGISPDSVRTIIERSADDVVNEQCGVGWDKRTGYGRVNALRALAWYGQLTSDTTWSDTVWISGDVIIPSGKTLTVNSGTVVEFIPGDVCRYGVDTARCEIIVNGGALKLNGVAGNRVILTSADSSESPELWHGIRVTSGDAKINSADIKYAYCGVEYANSASDTIKHCHFYNNQMYGIKANNSNLVIYDNIIEKDNTSDYLGYGIYTENSSLIRGNQIENYKYGIYAKQNASSLVDSNKITNGTAGVYCYDTDPFSIISLCFKGWFEDTYLRASNTSTVNVDSCYMDGDSTTYGLWYSRSGGMIRRNSIFNFSKYGIYSCNGGMVNLGETTSPGDNSIDGFEETVSRLVANKYKPPGVHIVWAQKNWWGTDDPDDSLFDTGVFWEPFLTSEPTLSNACSHYKGRGKIVSATPVAETFSLMQNYPNPFNPTTVIRFRVKSSELRVERPIYTTLTIYNILGQKVKTLVNEPKYPGTYEICWDGKDEKGQEVSSGIYFYRIKTPDYVEVKKMVLLK